MIASAMVSARKVRIAVLKLARFLAREGEHVSGCGHYIFDVFGWTRV